MSGEKIVFPAVSWATAAGSSTVPAATLNATATAASQTQLSLAADGAPLRILYGRVCPGAQIANIVPYNGNWIVQAIWGEGEIDSIVSCQLEDKPFAGAVTHYTGTAGQTVNATLVAAFAANGITYADALAGIAYSVFTLPAGITSIALTAVIAPTVDCT